jgi:hypothetical protein
MRRRFTGAARRLAGSRSMVALSTARLGFSVRAATLLHYERSRTVTDAQYITFILGFAATITAILIASLINNARLNDT